LDDDFMSINDHRKYKRLAPPAYLSEFAKGYWKRTLAELPPEAFSIADEPVLVAYFQEFELLQKLVTQQQNQPLTVIGGNGQPAVNPISNSIAKHNASLSQLASKLRLCPQARISTKSAQSSPEFKGQKETDGDEIDQLFLQ
jgi:P27 family predicted phage terminase small subunit